jgi:signal transduction histidine kinase
MVDLDSGGAARPALETPGVPLSSPAGGRDGPRYGRVPSPLRLRNWRVRWRLVALVVIPTVAAIALGAVRIQAARDTAADFAQVDQLAVLGSDVTALAQAIEDERDLTAGYIAAHQSAAPDASALSQSILGELGRQYAVTGARLAAVERLAGQIGPAYPAVARADLGFALSRVAALTGLRGLAHSQISALPMITDYTDVVSAMLAFDNEIAVGSSNAQLAQTVSSLGSLAQVEDDASQQRAILYAILLQRQFGLGGLQTLIGAQSDQNSSLATFQTVAANLPAYQFPSGQSPAVLSSSLSEIQQFNDTVAGPALDAAQSIEQDAIIDGENGTAPAGNAQDWYADMSATLTDMRAVEGDELASITAQAGSLQSGAEDSAQLTAGIVLVLLLLVLLVTIVMARSMSRPLRRLRSDALDVAGFRLPEMVRRLSESQAAGRDLAIEPIGIDSTDEIGEVARAFDQVHQEAVRLAGDEALLRANLNAMFVNLSRRSQSLIERQLGIIDSLEQTEQDPDRLSHLFRLDHLATRMRRNSENLLVLAGQDSGRRLNQAVALVDILRAAISEIEQYDRVVLNVQPGVMVIGRAVSDVIHLAAELVENATAFSAEETQVYVGGQMLNSGGVLLEITDNGVGIPDDELAHANWRLDHPPVVDVAVSRRMGLFVVGRLAARHGVRVRLQHAKDGGLTALIWLPDTVAEPDPTPPLGSLRRRFDVDRHHQAVSGQRRAPSAATSGGGWISLSAAPPPSLPPPPAPPLPPPPTSPVTVPAAPPGPDTAAAAQAGADPGQDQRLPIFELVESDWFRRSGKTFHDGERSAGTTTTSPGWTSPADEGWRAAQVVASPTARERTRHGLPKRVPNANLVPGSVRQSEADDGGTSARSADEMRDRLTGFQRGVREGRAAAPTSQEDGA